MPAPEIADAAIGAFPQRGKIDKRTHREKAFGWRSTIVPSGKEIQPKKERVSAEKQQIQDYANLVSYPPGN
jgi:hypothetical protein